MRIPVLFLALSLFGCNDERIVKLEKQNEQILAQLHEREAAADLDVQAKCAQAAKQFFREEWGTMALKAETMFLQQENHFSRDLDKCFIRVEHHRSLEVGKNILVYTTIEVTDVYENVQYGDFLAEENIPDKSQSAVQTCNVDKVACKTFEEFDKLIKKYMAN